MHFYLNDSKKLKSKTVIDMNLEPTPVYSPTSKTQKHRKRFGAMILWVKVTEEKDFSTKTGLFSLKSFYCHGVMSFFAETFHGGRCGASSNEKDLRKIFFSKTD